MPDEAAKPAQPTPSLGHPSIGEEMDSAKWTLPPAMPVVLVLVVLAIIVGVYSWLARPKPTSAGAITAAYSAESADKSSTMVLLHARIRNIGEKPLWMRNIKAQLKTDQGEWFDQAASPVDYPRYFQAFPDLAPHQMPPLRPETRIEPGAQQEGMVLVAFPVSKDAFDQRKSLTLIVENYDQKPTLISEKR